MAELHDLARARLRRLLHTPSPWETRAENEAILARLRGVVAKPDDGQQKGDPNAEETDPMKIDHLIVGHFYWVLPVHDPDTDEEWMNDVQPARYGGLDENGEQVWNCLGVEDSDWPIRWIGDEILATPRAKEPAP